MLSSAVDDFAANDLHRLALLYFLNMAKSRRVFYFLKKHLLEIFDAQVNYSYLVNLLKILENLGIDFFVHCFVDRMKMSSEIQPPFLSLFDEDNSDTFLTGNMNIFSTTFQFVHCGFLIEHVEYFFEGFTIDNSIFVCHLIFNLMRINFQTCFHFTV